MAKKKLFYLAEGNYDPTFLKALACAVHMECLEPEELEFWIEENWSQEKMAKEMYKRIKD